MDRLLQLVPFLWRARRLLAGSIAAALGVSLLWAMTLLLSFPLVKVLLEGQSIPEYLDHEIVVATKNADNARKALAIHQSELERRTQDNTISGKERLALLKNISRAQTRLSQEGWKVSSFSWLQARLKSILPRQAFPTLVFILLMLLVITLLKGVFTYLQENLVGRAVESIMLVLRQRLFQHTLRLDLQTLALTGTSDLMARFTYDMQQISMGLGLVGGRLTVEPLKVAGVLVCAFCVNWQLTTLSLLTVPIGGALFGRFGKKLKRASRRQMESMSRIYTQLEETFRTFRTITAFGNQRQHRRDFHNEHKVSLDKTMQILRMDAMASPLTEFLATVAVCLALLPGAYLVLRHRTDLFGVRLASAPMDIADLALLYTLLAGLLDPTRKLASVYPKMKKVSAACDRIFGLLHTSSRVREDRGPLALPRHVESIEFDRVSFTYAVKDDENVARPPALEGVSVKIPFGDTVAVVGGNGSGKSTLVHLLPRLYDPEHGTVRVDGIDLRHAALKDLRSQMAIVTQETLLFDRSIADNLRYGRPEATDEEVAAIAKEVHVMAFAERFPDQLDTVVGEKGGRLSGGQRQRIALGRALLRNPSILILDEATSAIDAESEEWIYEALERTAGQRTTLLITHCMTPALLRFVTRILVMEEGRLIDNGTHGELLERCPQYHRLYHAQTRQRAA